MREVFQIEVYEALKGKIGEQEAKLLIEYIELKKKEVATKEDIMRLEQSTKEDIMRLEEIVRKLEEFVKEEFQRIEQSTKEDIQRLEQFVREEIRRLEKRVEKVENEIIDLKKEQRRNLYWILGVHITLWATTIGGIITILLKMKF
jgi:predicted ribosome quality control (RQC) complex YloA/Tae2 family protein